jgi:hypothetical protein
VPYVAVLSPVAVPVARVSVSAIWVAVSAARVIVSAICVAVPAPGGGETVAA